MQPRDSKRIVTGEDLQNDEELELELELVRSRESRDGFLTTDIDTEHEGQAPQEVDEKSLELVSRSHFMLSLLPKDDLLDLPSITPSEKILIDRDQQRNQTMAYTELGSQENLLEQALLGQELFMIESINQGLATESVEEFDDDSWSISSGVDLEELERKREAALKQKRVFGEMVVCLEEVDAFNHQNPDADRVGSELDVTTITERKLKNPPGTPETGGAGQNSDVEEGNNRKKDNEWAVPVPSAIAKGDIELSPEEDELRAQLENEIRRLSLPGQESYIKTPSEMASEVTIPDTANSGEGGAYSTKSLYQKLLTTKIESPKRKFFAQVRIFNEFWNMAHPVCNQQGVRYWEVGLCDEDTAMEKSVFFWNELESRFDAKAKKVLETELKEEDEEILESLVKWGQPFDPTDMRYRDSKENEGEDEDEEDQEDVDTEDDSNNDDDDSDDQSKTDKSGNNRERDELTQLENKPDLYWKALKRREAERYFGDLKYYCPVTLADSKMLRKGSPKFACKYKDRVFYCADENSQLRFITNPKSFLPTAGPPMPPPPRICITGSPGCLQEEIAQELCSEFNVCYVNFRQRLHEILHARCEKEIGPEHTYKIVPKDETQRTLLETKPGDDLLYYEDEEDGEGGAWGGHVKFSFHQIPVTTALKERVLGLINIPSQELDGVQEQQGVQSSVLESLGLLAQHKIETVPLNAFERTERLTERRWEKLTLVETYIKAFIENGIQLPDVVLDQFVLPLWRDKPFTTAGFILVGFPNTDEDLEYMVRKNLIPEHMFVMECKPVVIRNRLIVPAVDRWHRQQNPSGKKQRRMTMRTQRAKMHMQGLLSAASGKKEVFPYQVEGRPEVDEFENETWTYNDAVSRDIARALRYFHFIYSAGLEKMKVS